jgi:hypothetical protein
MEGRRNKERKEWRKKDERRKKRQEVESGRREGRNYEIKKKGKKNVLLDVRCNASYSCCISIIVLFMNKKSLHSRIKSPDNIHSEQTRIVTPCVYFLTSSAYVILLTEFKGTVLYINQHFRLTEGAVRNYRIVALPQ